MAKQHSVFIVKGIDPNSGYKLPKKELYTKGTYHYTLKDAKGQKSYMQSLGYTNVILKRLKRS